jgi:hypothetical protein
MPGKPNGAASRYATNNLMLLAGLLGGILAVLFYRSFLPHQVLFANDSPLGAMLADCNSLPSRFFGTWRNTFWLGQEAPTATPTVSAILGTILRPTLWLKFYPPFTLFLVGFSAWVFFRSLRFSPAVCLLGGLAAALNMHFFSTACWGLGSWNVSAAMIFLALAALCTDSIKQIWPRGILAGLAVGMNVMEGFDVGAIMSIYVGIFILFKALFEEGEATKRATTAIVTEIFVVVFAGLIAANTIHSLVGTQVEEVVGTQQDIETKEKRWDPATQWSLPKVETVRLFTPGIFGYRLAQNITQRDKSAGYWGLVGQDPRIAKLRSDDPVVRSKVLASIAAVSPLYPAEEKGMGSADRQTQLTTANGMIQRLGYIVRHSGTGEYAGIMVAVMALFALANSCRGAASPYSVSERRAVWFWAAAALFSLLAAWGRFGFVYGLLYQLPYFSTIRNPIKFLHPFHLIWIILAGYGFEALSRRYLQSAVKRTGAVVENYKTWWRRAVGFDKGWVVGSVAVVVVAAAGVALLFLWQTKLAEYMAANGFTDPRPSPDAAPPVTRVVALKMAGFAAGEGLWFLGFLTASLVAVTGILAGVWRGARANSGWLILGTIMLLDLARSDVPWVHYFDYEEKYSSNFVTETLSDRKPWEQRVMGRLSPRRAGSSNGRGPFGQLYNFWMQNDFPYRGIQTLDFAEMPRMPALDDAYMHNFELYGDDIWKADLRPSARLWELTGTRYLLLDAGGIGLLNAHGDPVHEGFRLIQRMQIERKPGVGELEDAGDLTVTPDREGAQAIIEFSRVLPRAKLFAHWEMPADDKATLATLADTNFVPQQTVLISTNTPLAERAGPVNADAGTVEITDYHAKYIKLEAHARTASVLLLNDRYHPSWHVRVDGQPAPMLRCNYIMRGVYLPVGDHVVEFRYHTSLKFLYLSLLGWFAGIAAAGYLIYAARPEKPKAAPVEVKPMKK